MLAGIISVNSKEKIHSAVYQFLEESNFNPIMPSIYETVKHTLKIWQHFLKYIVFDHLVATRR